MNKTFSVKTAIYSHEKPICFDALVVEIHGDRNLVSRGAREPGGMIVGRKNGFQKYESV